jgi:glycerol dehydrogenase
MQPGRRYRREVSVRNSLARPLPNVPECKQIGLMHGEKVAFGVVTQLCLDDEFDTDEKYAIVDFEIQVGLPVTLAELNMPDAPRARLQQIAEACAGQGSLCHNHPFPVTAADVLDAILAADALGRQRHQRTGA